MTELEHGNAEIKEISSYIMVQYFIISPITKAEFPSLKNVNIFRDNVLKIVNAIEKTVQKKFIVAIRQLNRDLNNEVRKVLKGTL